MKQAPQVNTKDAIGRAGLRNVHKNFWWGAYAPSSSSSPCQRAGFRPIMRRLLLLTRFLTGFLAISIPTAQNAQASPKWLRRVTGAAACAASMVDLGTTKYAISSGGRERNPLLSDPGGSPRYGRMIGFKVGVCAGNLVIQEFLPTKGKLQGVATGINLGMTGAFAGAAIHNKGVGDRLRSRRLPKSLRSPNSW